MDHFCNKKLFFQFFQCPPYCPLWTCPWTKLEKMAKIVIFGPILNCLPQISGDPNLFLLVLPLWGVRHCSKLLLYAIWRKTNEANMRKWQKSYFWTRFWPLWLKFGPPVFFQKSGFISHYISWSAIIMYNIRKKTMTQSWGKLVMDR